jgi:hypothetical protein
MDDELQMNKNSEDLDIFGDQGSEDHVASSHPFSKLIAHKKTMIPSSKINNQSITNRGTLKVPIHTTNVRQLIVHVSSCGIKVKWK